MYSLDCYFVKLVNLQKMFSYYYQFVKFSYNLIYSETTHTVQNTKVCFSLIM